MEKARKKSTRHGSAPWGWTAALFAVSAAMVAGAGLMNRKPAQDAKSDEILRHVSRFGDWTLRRFYPVWVVTSYRMPVLAGSFAMAALLLAGGVAIVSWQRKATRRAEQRVSFVNCVSHELRTPLTNLLLNTDLARDGLTVGDDKVRRRLGLIREETSRLSRIATRSRRFYPTCCPTWKNTRASQPRRMWRFRGRRRISSSRWRTAARVVSGAGIVAET